MRDMEGLGCIFAKVAANHLHSKCAPRSLTLEKSVCYDEIVDSLALQTQNLIDRRDASYFHQLIYVTQYICLFAHAIATLHLALAS